MRNRYSQSEEGRKIGTKLDIRQLQKNVKKMKREVESVLNKQRQSPSPKHELPLISESKLIRCCDNSTPQSLRRSYEAIDRLIKWSVEKRNNMCEANNKKEKQETPTIHRKPKIYNNQTQLKNSVKKMRQEMNLYHSQFVSLRDSSKVLKKQDTISSLKAQNIEKMRYEEISQQQKETQKNQIITLSKELSTKKLKKKNSRSRKKHSKKFRNVLDLINRKVENTPLFHNESNTQAPLQKKSSIKRSRVRCYSENNCEGVSSLQNVLVKNSKPYQSIVLDYRMQMLRRQKEINKKKTELNSKMRIKSQVLSNYVDVQKYVMVLDKNKALLKKLKPPSRIEPINYNLTSLRKKGKPSDKESESKEVDLDFSPWNNIAGDELYLDNLHPGIENESTQISNQY